jgi:hypothetical protein
LNSLKKFPETWVYSIFYSTLCFSLLCRAIPNLREDDLFGFHPALSRNFS